MTTNKPVAWVTADTVGGQTVNGKPRRVWWENNEGVGIPIYAAPQPAEQKPAPDVAALVERLSKVIRDLESGFVACERCGDQEDTATLDCMPELTSIRNALAAAARKSAENFHGFSDRHGASKEPSHDNQ